MAVENNDGKRELLPTEQLIEDVTKRVVMLPSGNDLIEALDQVQEVTRQELHRKLPREIESNLTVGSDGPESLGSDEWPRIATKWSTAEEVNSLIAEASGVEPPGDIQRPKKAELILGGHQPIRRHLPPIKET